MATSTDSRHRSRMRQTELGAALQLPQQYACLNAGGLGERWRLYLAPQPHERLVYGSHLDNICQIGHTCKRQSALNMKYPAELYRRSPRPYRGLTELEYPFHDRTVTVTQCGRICMGRRKINLSTVFAGQNVGVKEFETHINAWHQGLAEPQAREDSRHWPAGVECAGGLACRCQELQERPLAGGVAGAGAQAGLERRETEAAGHEQARRHLPSNLLIRGARSASVAAQRKAKPNVCLSGLLTRRHPNLAAVALANKKARTIWTLLAHEREFRPDHVPRPATA